MLEILVVPACFAAAGLIGYRLGTPPRVAGGLVAVGTAHLLAFLGAAQALDASGRAADLIHLVSQWLFLGGFVALVWLAACYPTQRPRTSLIVAAGVLGAAGPLLAAISGPTPSVIDDTRRLGPVVGLLPESVAGGGAAPLLALPILAVITFIVRYRRASASDRAAMRWPIGGLVLIAALAIVGTLARSHEPVVTALFLLGAPLFPLAVAFGPVVRRIDTIAEELHDLRGRISRRPPPLPGVLARLTPRERSVLEAMAEGMANPVIARSMHLSLSSVEKHATSIFRKLEIPEGPDVHRRVAAVVAYRDALDSASPH